MSKTDNSSRPNIIVITTDQQRYETLGVTGNSVVRTTHLDRLAREGVLFTRAYCQNTVCIPSRACLHTGRYIHQHGVQYMESEIDTTPPLPPWEKTFMEHLQDTGYCTGAYGKIHMVQTKGYDETALTGGKGARWTQIEGQPIGPAPLGQKYAEWLEKKHPGGYEEIYRQRRKPEYRSDQTAMVNVLPEEEYVEYWIAEEAKNFLRRRKGSSQPFFLWVGFCGPHPPFDPPKRYAEMYPPEDMPLPKTFSPKHCENPEQEIKTLRKVIAYYYAMMTCIDDRVGSIIDELKQNGQRENTIIVFTSDHGEMLGDKNRFGKCCFYEPVIRIPTIINHPAITNPFCFDGLVETFSLAPTVLDFAGVKRPVEMAAESLVPILFEREKGRESILCEYVTNDRQQYAMCVRTEQYKLSCSWNKSGEHIYELYDLNVDPLEEKNMYDDPAYTNQRGELKNLLLNRIAETITPAYSSWVHELPDAIRS